MWQNTLWTYQSNTSQNTRETSSLEIQEHFEGKMLFGKESCTGKNYMKITIQDQVNQIFE